MRKWSGALLCAVFLVQPALAATTGADALLAQSRAAEHAGDRDRAERLAQAAIVADPGRASSYIALGDLYLRTDRSDFASFYYSEALSIDPSDKAAVHGLALADSQSQTAVTAADSLDKNHHDQ